MPGSQRAVGTSSSQSSSALLQVCCEILAPFGRSAQPPSRHTQLPSGFAGCSPAAGAGPTTHRAGSAPSAKLQSASAAHVVGCATTTGAGVGATAGAGVGATTGAGVGATVGTGTGGDGFDDGPHASDDMTMPPTTQMTAMTCRRDMDKDCIQVLASRGPHSGAAAWLHRSCE